MTSTTPIGRGARRPSAARSPGAGRVAQDPGDALDHHRLAELLGAAGSGTAEPRRELSIKKNSRERVGQRLVVADRYQEPFLAVAYLVRDATYGCRDDRRSGPQRLSDDERRPLAE